MSSLVKSPGETTSVMSSPMLIQMRLDKYSPYALRPSCSNWKTSGIDSREMIGNVRTKKNGKTRLANGIRIKASSWITTPI